MYTHIYIHIIIHTGMLGRVGYENDTFRNWTDGSKSSPDHTSLLPWLLGLLISGVCKTQHTHAQLKSGENGMLD